MAYSVERVPFRAEQVQQVDIDWVERVAASRGPETDAQLKPLFKRDRADVPVQIVQAILRGAAQSQNWGSIEGTLIHFDLSYVREGLLEVERQNAMEQSATAGQWYWVIRQVNHRPVREETAAILLRQAARSHQWEFYRIIRQKYPDLKLDGVVDTLIQLFSTADMDAQLQHQIADEIVAGSTFSWAALASEAIRHQCVAALGYCAGNPERLDSDRPRLLAEAAKRPGGLPLVNALLGDQPRPPSKAAQELGAVLDGALAGDNAEVLTAMVRLGALNHDRWVHTMKLAIRENKMACGRVLLIHALQGGAMRLSWIDEVRTWEPGFAQSQQQLTPLPDLLRRFNINPDGPVPELPVFPAAAGAPPPPPRNRSCSLTVVAIIALLALVGGLVARFRPR